MMTSLLVLWISMIGAQALPTSRYKSWHVTITTAYQSSQLYITYQMSVHDPKTTLVDMSCAVIITACLLPQCIHDVSCRVRQYYLFLPSYRPFSFVIGARLVFFHDHTATSYRRKRSGREFVQCTTAP
ncbi:hypothetical protein F5Y09DRAFT_280187 [Xylaria sp. FL1042]|nr:hypothetical protein F5Y09DRAFT_280187 [Xylaria sp. FL1042]